MRGLLAGRRLLQRAFQLKAPFAKSTGIPSIPNQSFNFLNTSSSIKMADTQTPEKKSPEKAKSPEKQSPEKQSPEKQSPEMKTPEKNKTPEKKDWKAEKERLAKMSPEERTERLTEMSAVFMASIPTWNVYFNTKKHELEKKLAEDKDDEEEEEEVAPPKMKVDMDLSSKVSLFQGDITRLGIDAIVNAANESLLGGGGVDGAIHRAAGRLLVQECETLNGCDTGDAKITGAYKLPARHVIHTVGPIGEKPEKLASCYKTSLELMLKHNLRTIAFPCISTGIYGYPSARACPVVLQTVRSFLEKHHDKVDLIIFCLFMKKDIDIYEREMQRFFPVSQPEKKGDE